MPGKLRVLSYTHHTIHIESPRQEIEVSVIYRIGTLGFKSSKHSYLSLAFVTKPKLPLLRSEIFSYLECPSRGSFDGRLDISFRDSSPQQGLLLDAILYFRSMLVLFNCGLLHQFLQQPCLKIQNTMQVTTWKTMFKLLSSKLHHTLISAMLHMVKSRLFVHTSYFLS